MFVKLLLPLAMLMALTTSTALASESDITLKTSTGTIYGTLSLAEKSPSPVVLIIAGSGPTDRNGNGPNLTTDTYKLLATELAQQGISSVRYDKRGIAASAAAMQSEKALRFDTYVKDAVAWVNLLHADSRFSRVVIAGHSEGSLIGMIAAQHAPVAAFVSIEGAGRPAAAVLREQLKPKLTPELYAASDAILTQLQQGHLVAKTPPQLAALFRPSVQPYLISWLKYDPAVEIAKLSIPVVIVQGRADIQVTIEDANALIAHSRSYQAHFVDGMNHVLKHAPNTADSAAIMKGYSDPTLPIESAVVSAVGNGATETDGLVPRTFPPFSPPQDWVLVDSSNNSNSVGFWERYNNPEHRFSDMLQYHVAPNSDYAEGVTQWRDIVSCKRGDTGDLLRALKICGFAIDRDEKCGNVMVHRFVRDANLGPRQLMAQTSLYVPRNPGAYEIMYQRADTNAFDNGTEKIDDTVAAVNTWCEAAVTFKP